MADLSKLPKWVREERNLLLDIFVEHSGTIPGWGWWGRKLDRILRYAAEQQAEVKQLREALTEVTKGTGAFSRDPLTHAENCIKDMMDVALCALADAPEAPGRGPLGPWLHI